MYIDNLLTGEHFDTAPGTFQALLEVFPGFIFAVRRKLNDMETLQVSIERFQLGDQRWLAEQKYMRTPFRCTRRQLQQGLECRLVELFRIVHQQINFLPSQRQLHDLGQQLGDFRLSHTQRLSHLAKYAGRITGTAGRNHDTLYRLLIGAGHQCLAQQGLAAALRAGHHQQQLAITRQVVQLPKHRLALGWEEFETRHPCSEGVMVQLVMAEKGLVGVQTSHRTPINLKAGPRLRGNPRPTWPEESLSDSRR
ncbi:hypothetical protein D3C81_881790 [compost metagenome]